MTEKTKHVQLISHPQSLELRLEIGEHQTSYTLKKGHTLKATTLEKIEVWLRSRSDASTATQLLAQVRQLTSPSSMPPAPPKPKEAAPKVAVKSQQVGSGLTIVCDYSAQGEAAAWACAIGEGTGQVLVCGPVPKSERGERYAVLRTHHYLQRLGCAGTIFCDEQGTVDDLSRWYPAKHIDRSAAQHKPAHQLAHNFALLLAGKAVTGPVSDLKVLSAQVWPEQGLTDFIRLPGEGWKVVGSRSG